MMAEAPDKDFGVNMNAGDGSKKEKQSLEELPKEDLIKQVKRYLIFLQKAKSKCEELNKKCQNVEKERDVATEALMKLKSASQEDDISSKLSERESEVLQLRDELSKTKEDRDAYSKCYRDAEEQMQCLTMKLDTLKATCQCLQEEVSKSHLTNKELTDEVNVLTAARDTALQTLKNVKEELSVVMVQSDNRLAEIKKLQELQKELEVKLSISTDSNENQAKNFISLENINKTLENENVDLVKKYKLLYEQSEEWKRDLKKLKKEKEQFNEEMQKLSALEDENIEMQKILNAFKEKSSDVENKNKELEIENLNLKDKNRIICEENETWKSRLTELKSEKGKLNEDIQRFTLLENENVELQKLLNEFKDQLIDLKNKQEELEKEKLINSENNETISKENETLKLELQQYKAEKTPHSDAKQNEPLEIINNNDIEKYLNEVKTEIPNLDDQSKELRNEIFYLKDQLKRIAEEFQMVKLKLEKYDTDKNHLKADIEIALCDIKNENSSLVEKMKDMCDENNILKEKLDAYESEKLKLADNSNMKVPDVARKNDKLEDGSAPFSEQCKALVEENSILKTKLDECDCLKLKQKASEGEVVSVKRNYNDLITENSTLIEKCESLSNENDILKQQLDEYENDIQKHLNLENENYALQTCLKDIEKENYDLNERLENKCIELDEFNCQLELLIMSIKQGVKQKKSVATFKSENEPLQNIYVLKALYDDMGSQLGNNSIKIKSLETDLANTLKQKQSIDKELIQVKDLKQFLEDEARELRVETEQLKTNFAISEVDRANCMRRIQRLESDLHDVWGSDQSMRTTSELNNNVYNGSVDFVENHVNHHLEIRHVPARTISNNASTQIYLQFCDQSVQVDLSIEQPEQSVNQIDSNAEIFSNVINEWGCVDENNAGLVSENKEEICGFSKLWICGETNSKVDTSSQINILFSDQSVQVDLSAQLPEQLHNPRNSNVEVLSDVINEWGCVDKSNEGLDFKIQKYEESLQNMTLENDKLKSLLESKSRMVENIHCEMDSLLTKIEELSEELEEKNSDLEKASRSNIDLQKQLKQEKNFEKSKQKALTECMDLIKNLGEMKKKIPVEIETLKSFWINSLSITSSSVYTLKQEYNNCCVLLEKYKEKNMYMSDEISILKTGMFELGQDITSVFQYTEEGKYKVFRDVDSNLTHNINTKRQEMNDDSIFDDKDIKYLKSDSNNFAADMQSFSMVKQKLISKLKQLKCEVRSSFEIISQMLLNNNKTAKELSHCKVTLIPSYEKTIEHLEEQLRKQSHILRQEHLRAAPSNEDGANDPRGDKTSTEILQKQLSDTEAKMNKFKVVAIKLKKELAESKRMYEEALMDREKYKKKVNETSHELDNISSAHCQYVRNYQSLQMGYDKIQDESEILKETTNQLKADLSSTLLELNNTKQRLGELNIDLKKSKESLDLFATEKMAKEKKCTELESKVIVLELKYSESQVKIRELEADFAKSQKGENKITEDNKQLKAKLDDALKEGKKHDLLNLEMEDYDRTISELTSQLQKKSTKINELQTDIECYKTKIEGMQEEMRFCESHKETEEKRADNFKQALEDTKRELTTTREHEKELISNVSKLQIQLEAVAQQEEDCKSQLSKASVEVEQLKEMMKSSADNHQRIVRSLDSKVASQKQEILLAHKEVESVKQEFENYKIRVHSVLKQQKTVSPFPTIDADIKEKLENLNEKLKLQVKDLSEKLKALTLENESLREEHDHLLQRHNKIVEELEIKDRNWNHRLELISAEKNRLQAMHEDMNSQHALQSEMLASTYKKQMRIIQEEHKRTIEDLQKQLEAADKEITRLQRESQKAGGAGMTSAMMDDNFAFDVLSQERQEGEGSEFTDGENSPIKHLSLATIPTSGFMPFEKLLQSPAEPESPASFVSNQDSDRLTTELTSSWKKIDHLSEILNDSEANNLRLTEQVRVLKEEVRRLERNKQREEHSENLEYLKNVIVKFSTLQPGTERATLVPVLTTMLKLSPLEQNQLKQVAGEGDPSDTSASGWGSYLHRWSSLI